MKKFTLYISCIFFCTSFALDYGVTSAGATEINPTNISQVNTSEFYEVLMAKDKSYEFKNTSGKELQLLTSADIYYTKDRYDIIKYNSTGDIISYNYDQGGEINLAVGDKIKINLSKGELISLYIPYEYRAMIKEIYEPVFYKVPMDKIKNYEFKNTSGKELQLLTSADIYYTKDRYDLIKYNLSGDIISSNYDQGGEINLAVGDKIKINLSKGELISLYIPYEYRAMIKEIYEPVFYKVPMDKTKNYEFENTSGKELQLLTSADIYYTKDRYDIIKYNSTGDIISSNYDQGGEINFAPNDKIKINSSIGEIVSLYIPYEYRAMYKEVATPVFYKINLEKGKSYEFNNTYGKNIEILTTATNSSVSGRYDIIQYDSKGNISSNTKNESGSIKLNVGDRSKINLSNETNVSLYVPYEYKEMCTESIVPVFYEVTLTTDQSFIFKNNSNAKIVIFNNSNYLEKRYTFDKYNRDGSITTTTLNSFGSITLEVGETIDIKVAKGTEIKFSLPFESKDDIFEKEDVNTDKSIDILDLSNIAIKYNEESNIEIYSKYDLNRDGIIDIFDIVSVARKIK